MDDGTFVPSAEFNREYQAHLDVVRRVRNERLWQAALAIYVSPESVGVLHSFDAAEVLVAEFERRTGAV